MSTKPKTRETSLHLRIRQIAEEVVTEVERAMHIHKGMNSLHEAKAVIEEEFDEFWDLVKVNPSKLSSVEQQTREIGLHSELIQTAAMCVRSIIDLKL